VTEIRPIDVRPVVLEGQYVRLEPMAPEHLEGLWLAAQDDDIWLYMPRGRPQSRDDVAQWLAEAMAGREAGRELGFSIFERATGDIVGSTRYLNISPRDRRLEIGWTWLHPRVRRTAVNTECKYLLLSHAFETLGCARVELKADARNERSRAAMLRIGAVFEGVHRKHMLTQGGHQRDTAWYSFIDEEWPAAKVRLESMLAR
jgi:RimJ/RimL family protein N-acetyltransferase